MNYKRSESSEQIAVIDWCRINECMHPELELIHHIPNGGKRNKSEAIRLKREGVKAGVPDLFLPVPQIIDGEVWYHGLYIEMKFGVNKTTVNQRYWIKRLEEQGYHCAVCNGADEAVKVIKEYLQI